MKVVSFFKNRNNLALTIILVAAFGMRFFRLNFQSLWLDELHTMRESDPTISISALFGYLRCCDQHPPLYFFMERILFTVFGHTEFVARCLSAVIGVVSVWALYLLGKELLNKSLGLIAAALTCVNYFNLYYSQEARGYILAFLLSALSWLFFIRLIKYLRRKDIWLYALFTLLVMYTHYYGLMVAASEFFVAFALLFAEKERRPAYFRSFAISGVVIAVGFAPWLPFISDMSQIKSFWISPIAPDFYFTYFKSYFGDSAFLMPLIMILLISYTLHTFRSEALPFAEIRNKPLLLSFAIVFASALITYIIPYLRSLLVVPMLFDRYTIVLLPLFLLVIAYGLELIRYQPIKYMVLGAFILISLMDIVVVKRYYTNRSKTQFRELNQFITSDKRNQYPILNDRTGWQEEYYLRHFGYTAPVFEGKKEAILDSILKGSSSKYKVKGFWLMDAHGAGPKEGYLNPALKAAVDSAFVLIKDGTFVDAWAQLYLTRSEVDGKFLMLSSEYGFSKGNVINYSGQNVIVNWGGTLVSNPFELKKGDYEVVITAAGTQARHIYPHLVIYINEQKAGDYFVTGLFEKKSLSFHMPADSKDTRVKIVFDNDLTDPVTKDDRNALISNILFTKQ